MGVLSGTGHPATQNCDRKALDTMRRRLERWRGKRCMGGGLGGRESVSMAVGGDSAEVGDADSEWLSLASGLLWLSVVGAGSPDAADEEVRTALDGAGVAGESGTGAEWTGVDDTEGTEDDEMGITTASSTTSSVGTGERSSSNSHSVNQASRMGIFFKSLVGEPRFRPNFTCVYVSVCYDAGDMAPPSDCRFGLREARRRLQRAGGLHVVIVLFPPCPLLRPPACNGCTARSRPVRPRPPPRSLSSTIASFSVTVR